MSDIPYNITKERFVSSREDALNQLRATLLKMCHDHRIPKLKHMNKKDYKDFVIGIIERTTYDDVIDYFVDMRHYDKDRRTIDYILDYYIASLAEDYLLGGEKREKRHHQENLNQYFQSVTIKTMENFLLPYWTEDKTIYKPDTDFCEILKYSRHPMLSKKILKNLKNRHFYIDFSDCTVNISGTFVDIFPKDDHAVFIFMIISDEEQNLITNRFSYEYLDNGVLNADLSETQGDWQEGYKKIVKGKTKTKITSMELNNIEDAIKVIFQFICYISSQTPDLSPQDNIIVTGRKHGTYFRKKTAGKRDIDIISADWNYGISEGDEIDMIKWIPPTYGGGFKGFFNIIKR